MVFYVKQGILPATRHTYLEKENLLREELLGEESFDGPFSLLYHRNEPTRVKEFVTLTKDLNQVNGIHTSTHKHFRTSQLKDGGDFITGRKILLGNDDVFITFSRSMHESSKFMRSGLRNILIFVHKGECVFESVFGSLHISQGDYLYIPKGTTFRFIDSKDLSILAFESKDPIGIPDRYLNKYGQLKEGAFYYDRNIRFPELLQYPVEKEGEECEVYVDFDDHYVIEKRDRFVLDVIGWDGYNYPFSINIRDLMPMVGKVHLPPPFHETFSSRRFMVATFLPRPFDFHENSVPISYYHSNVDTDEVLFYSSGNFMSRRGIDEGSMTLHVRGMIHGPQPGAVEDSIGKKSTDEIGVMIETYGRLSVFPDALAIEDKDYLKSWYA